MNSTSSRLYYTYATNGLQYEIAAPLESQKYKLGGGGDVISSDGGPLAGALEKGSKLGLIPSDYGDSSLVGLWTFDEGTGTVAYDYSGNNATGTWNGTAPYYSGGKIGSYAGSFDGATDYVLIGSSTNLYSQGGSITVTGWAYHNSYAYPKTVFPIGTPHAYISGNGGWSIDSAYNASGLVLSFNDKTNIVNQANLNFDSGYQPGNFLNQWVFLAVVFDRSVGQAYAYVNSVRQSGSVNISSVTGNVVSSESINIGSLAGWMMSGSIDDVRIYNRALSAGEVAALYNGGK